MSKENMEKRKIDHCLILFRWGSWKKESGKKEVFSTCFGGKSGKKESEIGVTFFSFHV